MIELKYVHQVLAVKIFSILVYSMPDGHTDLNFAHQTAGTRQRKLLSTRSMLASASGIDLRKPKKNIRKMSISLISKTFTPHRTAESRYRPVVKSRKISEDQQGNICEIPNLGWDSGWRREPDLEDSDDDEEKRDESEKEPRRTRMARASGKPQRSCYTLCSDIMKLYDEGGQCQVEGRAWDCHSESQGCSGIGKKDPESIFFLRPFLLD